MPRWPNTDGLSIKSGFGPEPAGAPLRRWIPRVLFFVFALLMLTTFGVIQLLREDGSVVLAIGCLSWPIVYCLWRFLLWRIDRSAGRNTDVSV